MSPLHTGFHRIGITIAAPLVLVPAAIIAFLAAIEGISDFGELLVYFLPCLLGAAGVYAICRALAWIIEGFRGR